MLKLKRVYEPASATDGTRFLIERLWPRGIRKEALLIKAWIKEAAPSTVLRQWFQHDPARWDEFRSRYFAELEQNSAGWAPLLEAAREGAVTLVYSSHDTEHNNAVALKEFLERHLKEKRR